MAAIQRVVKILAQKTTAHNLTLKADSLPKSESREAPEVGPALEQRIIGAKQLVIAVDYFTQTEFVH